MPQGTPFTIQIDREKMEVRSIVDANTYRVRRGAEETRPATHPVAATVWARLDDFERAQSLRSFRALLEQISFSPKPGQLPPSIPVVELRELRVAGLAQPRTPAERVWKRWFERTPAALEGNGPGLVDNQYVSWLF